MLGLLGHVRGIADHAVAHQERLLGRFDNAVEIFEGLGFLDTEPLEDRKDHQRGKTLRRGRKVVERRALDRDGKCLAALRLMGAEVGQRHG